MVVKSSSALPLSSSTPPPLLTSPSADTFLFGTGAVGVHPNQKQFLFLRLNYSLSLPFPSIISFLCFRHLQVAADSNRVLDVPAFKLVAFVMNLTLACFLLNHFSCSAAFS